MHKSKNLKCYILYLCYKCSKRHKRFYFKTNINNYSLCIFVKSFNTSLINMLYVKGEHGVAASLHERPGGAVPRAGARRRVSRTRE